MGELKTAFDVLLVGVADFMQFYRNFWGMLPLVVKALIVFVFGLAVLFGVLRMCF